MSPFFTYLILVNIALALFYLLYVIVLKRDTFLRLRRFFFLSVIVFSLLYPFFTIPALSGVWPFRSSGFQESVVAVIIGEPNVEAVIEEEVVARESIAWETVLFLLYSVVTLVFLLRFVFQLSSIYRIRAKSEKQIVAGTPVYRLESDITPFSFFGLIFIHTGKHSDAELSQILLHEQTHVRQFHSVDIILIELVSLLSWWNPFVWLMKREMSMNLEYLADNGVLRKGVDSREYQYHLLRLTYHETAVPIVNNFNVSQLKRRIMMMNKTKSPAFTLAKYFLVVPLLFFLFVMASSVYAAQNETGEIPASPVEHNDLPEPPPEKKKTDMDDVFVVVEEPPQFPGGMEALMRFVSDNIRYPKEAQESAIMGRVICQFVITKDGSIENVEVIHRVDPLLDAEAVRVLQLMPKWTPGKQRGQEVNVQFTIPVIFKLESTESTVEERKAFYEKMEGFESAEFPGGEKAFMKYLSENVKYPVVAQENGIQGLVSIVFNVNSKGKVTFVRFEKEVDPSLDAEAKRVIERMPDWTPAKIKGEPTGMTTGTHFVFRLQGGGVQPYEGPVPENAVVVVAYGKEK
jgi:TonB family protein